MPDAPNQQAALGKAIRRIREREGLTQEELAFRAGVHPTWVSRLESGRWDPRWSSVRKAVEGLGITLVELVAMAERAELD
jgi:XRE family transcriptional regulator, regulator of sulfur utilization